MESWILLVILMLCLAVLPQGHAATGAMGDKLMRALRAGTYVIKKSMDDANEVRSLLCKVIASRKSGLETKARRGVQQGVVKGGCRKRKCSGSNPTGESFFAGTNATAG
jgi:hypothetical protein